MAVLLLEGNPLSLVADRGDVFEPADLPSLLCKLSVTAS